MSTKNGTRRIAAAVLLLGLGALVALAPAATTIRVTPPGGEVRRVNIANPPHDVADQEYMVDGEPREVTGVSLSRLLRRAGVPPAGWLRVRVGSVVLTDDQYQAFPDETPPAFFVEGGNAKLIVPDQGDATGQIVPAPRVAARGYSVRITPEDDEIDAGKSITFRAEVNGRPGGGLKFIWDRDGQDARSGRSVTYRFPERGRFAVRVTVSKGSATLAFATTTVNVDRKPDDDDGSGGASTGTGGAGYSDPSASSDSTGTTPSYTSPTYDPPSTTPSTPSTSPEATPDETDPAPPADQATEVAGDLLAATTPIPSTESDGAAAGLPDVPEESADDQELAISGAAVAAGVAAVLLGLGAGWEFERIRPRRWLRRPDLSRLRSLLPR